MIVGMEREDVSETDARKRSTFPFVLQWDTRYTSDSVIHVGVCCLGRRRRKSMKLGIPSSPVGYGMR